MTFRCLGSSHLHTEIPINRFWFYSSRASILPCHCDCWGQHSGFRTLDAWWQQRQIFVWRLLSHQCSFHQLTLSSTCRRSFLPHCLPGPPWFLSLYELPIAGHCSLAPLHRFKSFAVALSCVTLHLRPVTHLRCTLPPSHLYHYFWRQNRQNMLAIWIPRAGSVPCIQNSEAV